MAGLNRRCPYSGRPNIATNAVFYWVFYAEPTMDTGVALLRTAGYLDSIGNRTADTAYSAMGYVQAGWNNMAYYGSSEYWNQSNEPPTRRSS